MNRNGLVVSLGLAAGLAAVLSAQVPSSNGNVDQKTIQSIRVKVIGCVAGGSEAGHYRLTNASSVAMMFRQPSGRWGRQAPDRTSPSRTARRSTSSVAISRHTWATRSKSSASPVTRN